MSESFRKRANISFLFFIWWSRHMSSHLIPAGKTKNISSPAWEFRRETKMVVILTLVSWAKTRSHSLGPEAALRRCRTGPPPPVCISAVVCMSNAKRQEYVREWCRWQAQTEKRNYGEMWFLHRSALSWDQRLTKLAWLCGCETRKAAIAPKSWSTRPRV